MIYMWVLWFTCGYCGSVGYDLGFLVRNSFVLGIFDGNRICIFVLF